MIQLEGKSAESFISKAEENEKIKGVIDFSKEVETFTNIIKKSKILNEETVKRSGVCRCETPRKSASDNSICKRCKKKLRQTASVLH